MKVAGSLGNPLTHQSYYFLVKCKSHITSKIPIKNPTWANTAPTANSQPNTTGPPSSGPNKLYSMIGAALANTNIKLSAIIFIPRGDLLCSTMRMGFHIAFTTSNRQE